MKIVKEIKIIFGTSKSSNSIENDCPAVFLFFWGEGKTAMAAASFSVQQIESDISLGVASLTFRYSCSFDFLRFPLVVNFTSADSRSNCFASNNAFRKFNSCRLGPIRIHIPAAMSFTRM